VADRIRTAKARAQRIDMEYFKRLHPFRRWKLSLSIAAPLLVTVWLGAATGAGSRAPFSSGPVAQAHQVFGQQCEKCHVTEARVFRTHVTDAACLSCHEAPAHKANQTFTPGCASCHLEHHGPTRLAAVADERCEQCHGNLATANGQHAVLANVGAFGVLAGGHPEFAARRDGAMDRSTLHFSHEAHLQNNLRGPQGNTKLACESCHMPEVLFGPASGPPRRRELMTTVNYAKNCAPCHALYFDPLVDVPVPHDTPEVVHAFVTRTLQRYIASHPAQIGRPDPVRGRIPVNFPAPMRAVRNAAEWTAERTAAAERLLWSKTCAECHTMVDARNGSLPRVAASNVATLWMPRARFDHRPHRMTACAACHAAATSRSATDVLMPSIATCRQCHATSTSTSDGGTGGAESRCFECHDYHDWRSQDESHRRQAG
jgi:predicted CXXCH cytochrome family protein